MTKKNKKPKALHKRYFNRELSWLKFNWRVLEEADNSSYPLLERLRFLSISGSNLDEFFMVRVAGLMGQQSRGIDEPSVDGRTPRQQLKAIAKDSDALMVRQQKIWAKLKRRLASENVKIVALSSVGKIAMKQLEKHFTEQILPMLTPQALDPAHPFPFIPNLGRSLIFDMLRKPDGENVRQLVMVPAAVPRFIRVPGKGDRFLAVDALIKRFVGQLFPNHKLLSAGSFRITRDSDIEVAEEAEDLVRYFRSAIQRRRRGIVIRLELENGLPDELEALIREGLGCGPDVITDNAAFIGMADIDQLVDQDFPKLKFTAFAPRMPERVREHDGDCFAAIRQKDFVIHHPYESFEVVRDFVEQAANDPDVVAIKQTLYRAGKQSQIIRSLCRAAEAGKSVTAVVELKARFDEEQNLMWASQLENAGVQVVYGFVDMKTHAKLSMVVRREDGKLRTYCHFGTGNYHPVTARIYTDFSYFTADEAICRDAAQLFNYITGYIKPQRLDTLSMSPLYMREDIMRLIDDEIAHAKAGRPAAMWVKLNALVDDKIIDKLYEASEAGVEIDMMIRGICCLRPGVRGMSSRIRVKSTVGRFLEHSRAWAFGAGHGLPHPQAKLFISSADWMQRNLDRRVEYMLPITDPTVHSQVMDQVLVANLLDNQQSWTLQSDGSYERIARGERPFNLHQYFMHNPSLSGRGEALAERKDVPELRLAR